MVPVLQKIKLNDLPERDKICKCKRKCGEAVSITTYNDGMILCMKDARKYLYKMISLLDDSAYTSWTEDDEEQIIDLVKRKGMYRGINRDIAEMFGKTYSQAKSKTRRMKQKGLI